MGGGRLVLRRLDSALRPKERETVSWRPHHGMSENAAGGPGGAAVSHGVRTQWQRAGTVQPLCSQTPRLPWDVRRPGRSSQAQSAPFGLGPRRGLWVPGCRGCRPLEERQRGGHVLQGSGAEHWSRRRRHQRFMQVTCHVCSSHGVLPVTCLPPGSPAPWARSAFHFDGRP